MPWLILSDQGIEIVWHEAGWPCLLGELRPGTLGAELLEMEQS